MSDDAPSDQDTVASDEPKVASAALGRPGDKNMPQKKDLDALFKEAFERVEDMTPEEREEHFPWLSERWVEAKHGCVERTNLCC